MGCFNVACGISGVTIVEGERMGALLIRKKKDYSSANHTDTNKSDQYFMTSDLYVPITPPVYGEYDDYGGLSNIENSPVVNYLKEDFGMPVELLFDCLNAQSPFRLSSDNMKFFYDYSNDSSSQYIMDNRYTEISSVDFSKFGWEWSDENSEWVFEDSGLRKCFALSFPTDKNFAQLRVWIDDHKDYVRIEEFFGRSLMEFIEWFSSVSGIWLGMSDMASRSFEMTRGITFMPFVPEIFESLKNQSDNDFLFKYSLNNFDEVVDSVSGNLSTMEYDSDMVMFVQNFMLDDKIDFVSVKAYRDLVNWPEFWKDLVYFSEAMRQVNRVYSPTNTIKQGADFESERILGQFIVNRAERKIKEIDEF